MEGNSRFDSDVTYIGPIPDFGSEQGSSEKLLKEEVLEGPDQLRINDRDRELFSILLAQRFLTLELMTYRFEPKLLTRPRSQLWKSALYRRVLRLVRAGYLRTGNLREKTVYSLGQKGLGEIQNPYELSLPSDLDKVTTEHELICSEMRFYLESHGGTGWCSEPQLRVIVNRHKPGSRKIPDGAMKMHSRFLFVEVELSQKARDRYDWICRWYSRDGGPDRVLYVYRQKSDVEYLMSLAGPNQRFAFFRYVTPLPPPEEWIGFRGNDITLSLDDFLRPPVIPFTPGWSPTVDPRNGCP